MSAPQKTELLAPAGSIEAFFAALEFGADAVYCGLKEFSARAKAKNFTLAELGRLTAYSHQHSKRLYLALNTLVKEAELPKLIDTLAELAAMGIDGLIIQDLGVWRLCRRHYPQVPLHASTQMTVHNAAGVKMLEEMGFTRAVLARELTLTEIAAIRKQTTIELEHFVHGALCFSISGQCLFSSYLSGQSGNRGRCAQPCRRRYLHRQQPGYYFSPSDFCALELLPELTSAGIMSLKIEGRMKSAEYVARVVAAYRLMIDAPPRQRKEALREAHEILALAFGRKTTKGFLSGQLSAKLADPDQHGTLGQPLGTVASVRAGSLGLTTSERLHVGDRVRVQPQNDQAGSGFTVKELTVGEKRVKAAKAGEFVRVALPEKIFCRPGDTLFKVGGKPLFTLSPEACQKRLSEITAAAVPPELATTIAGQRAAALAGLLPAMPPTVVTTPRLTVRGRTMADLPLLDDPMVAQLELPLTPANLDQLAKAARRLSGRETRIIWDIPLILWPAEWPEYRRAVQMVANQGYTRFRVNNLGHLPLFAGLTNITLLGGFRCYILNSQAALAWQELGLTELASSIEDDRQNLAALLSRGLPLMVTIHGPATFFLSRIPLRLKPGTLLHSDKGEGYRLGTAEGLTTVSSEQDFSLLGRLHELRALGAGHFLIDLSHCGTTSAKGKEVLAAYSADQPLAATFAWNFDRGLA
ncbi:MAG: U32 family peptidase [Thermodesulfobacteriota bacterium]